MEKINIEKIRKLNPCYDPSKYISEDWEGTVINILEDESDCPGLDRIWVAVHFIDDKTLRLFAVWCAREVLKLVDESDKRSVEACNVAERFAIGEASKEELAAARDAARAAAKAAKDAAWAAAWAAWDAAMDAARAAAMDAAMDAARAAAMDAAKDAATDAAKAAWDAAWTGAIDGQIKKLVEMIKVEVFYE